MARVLITDTYLSDIAGAIRGKLGVQSTYTPPQMAGAIASIPTGGAPVLQSKTVTENGTVTPDAGYDGLSEVVVNVQGGGGGSVYMHSVTLTQYQFIAKALIVSSSGTPFTYDSLVQWLNNNGFNTSSDDGVYPIIGKDGSGSSNNLIGIYYNGNNLTAVKSGGGSNANTFTVVDAVVSV